MRIAIAIVVITCAGWAQFKSTAPLVVAPTTVTDSKGRYVDGLMPENLILYDNNVPQARGVEVWAAMRFLGRAGVRDLIRRGLRSSH